MVRRADEAVRVMYIKFHKEHVPRWKQCNTGTNADTEGLDDGGMLSISVFRQFDQA